MNMAAMGAHLSLFIFRFFDCFFKETIETLAASTPNDLRGEIGGRRTSHQYNVHLAMFYILGQEILGRLDFLDEADSDPFLLRASKFMTDYFDELHPNLMMSFHSTTL